MNAKLFAAAVLLSSTALGGCGNRYFSPRATNPVIEDRVRAGDSPGPKMSVVSTRADRRTIMIVRPDRICAEPPPDVGEAVSSQALAQLNTGKVSSGVASSLQTSLLQLAQRSQGLELFRTTSFVLCNMYLNGVFDHQPDPAGAYRKMVAQAFNASAALVAQQIAKGSLPGVLGTLQSAGATKLTLDLDKFSGKTGETPPSGDPAPAPTPTSTPTPTPTPAVPAVPDADQTSEIPQIPVVD